MKKLYLFLFLPVFLFPQSNSIYKSFGNVGFVTLTLTNTIDSAIVIPSGGSKKFDFISIDCEGLDGDILEQIDLTETSCVCIEWNGNEMLKTRFSNYMNDFKIIYTSPENLIYVR